MPEHASLHLDGVPTEILAAIVSLSALSPAQMRMLVQPAFDTGLPTFAHASKHVDYQTLKSIRLTCHRLSAIARDFLFRAVEVRTGKGLAQLIRALICNPALGPLVGYLDLSLPLDPATSTDYQNVASCWREILKSTSLEGVDHDVQQLLTSVEVESTNDIRDERRLDWLRGYVVLGGIKYGGFLGGLVGILVSLVPNVQALQISTVHPFGQKLYATFRMQRQILDTLMALIADMKRGSPERTLMPKLTTLHLDEGSSEEHSRVLDRPPAGLFRTSLATVLTLTTLFPNLRTVQSVSDNFIDDRTPAAEREFDTPSLHDEKATGITELSVGNCCHLAASMRHIALYFPNLRRLHVRISKNASLAEVTANDHPQSVDSSLQTMAPSLEDLELEMSWRPSFQSQLGQERRLTKLNSLNRLKHLSIPLSVICSRWHPFADSDESELALFPLAEQLPDSLHSFCLKETLQMAKTAARDLPTDEYRTWKKGEYELSFSRMLLRYCKRDADKQPRLKMLRVVVARTSYVLEREMPAMEELSRARGTSLKIGTCGELFGDGSGHADDISDQP